MLLHSLLNAGVGQLTRISYLERQVLLSLVWLLNFVLSLIDQVDRIFDTSSIKTFNIGFNKFSGTVPQVNRLWLGVKAL